MNSPNNRLNEKFQALADNTRREILALLKKSSLSAGEISNHFTISSASISYHLKKLESSGIITFEKFGKYRKYKINDEAFEEVYLWIKSLISH